MHIRDLAGKRICVLGYGKEGRATVKALEHFAPGCNITISDQNPSAIDQNVTHAHQVGSDWLKDLETFDVLIKSPGIKPIPEIEKHRDRITSATQIFLDSVAGTGALTIGVTGSKGKSTTASLIYAILAADGRKVFLIGNIGFPALEKLADASKETIFVMEMSSFQLLSTARSPHIAVITSFFHEHIDYHGSTDAYLEAKGNIVRFQTDQDIVVYNALSDGAKELALKSQGKKISFQPSDAPLPIEKTNLLGAHNLGNIAAAFKIAEILRVPKETCLKVFEEFHGLPHRLQSLGVIDGIEWINDSISTNPNAAIAALDALGDQVAVMMLGGYDRGTSFAALGERVAASHVRTVILLGQTGKRIREAIEKAGSTVQFLEATSMEEAVKFAKENVKNHCSLPTVHCPLVLLSPASPSYDMFKNFEERGKKFLDAIKHS